MAGRNNTPASRKRPREPSCTPPASPNQSLQSQPSSPRQARPSPRDLVHQPSAGTSNTWAPYQSAGSQTNRGAKTRAAAAAAAALAAAASANSVGHPFNWAQPTSEVHKSKTKERAPSPGRSTSSLVSSSSPDPQPLALVHHTRPAVGASSESQASSTSSGAAGASSPVPGSSNSSRRSAVVLPASPPPSSSPASSTGTGARGTAKATKRDREREPKPTTTTTTNNTFSSKESPASGPPSAHNGLVVVSALCRQQMKEAFQPWVLQTYGDAAKTKTISRRKFERISKILKGEDRSNGADSSKFRFWVRAKGFRLGPPPHMAAEQTDAERNNDDQEALYVVTGSYKDSSGVEQAQYKKVAVVENFFDIIYHEHVENGGRLTGKHAGQKRTYKAITEIHAFLPREAVTRFLLQCAECQRRGTYIETGANGSPSRVETPSGSPPSTPVPPDHQQQQPASRQASSGKNTHSTKSPPPSLHPPQPTPHRRGGGPRGSGGVGPVAWPAFPGTLPPLAWGPNWTPVAGGSSNGNSNGDGDPQRSPSFYTLKASDIDLSLPLTTTLLKHARRVGLPEERLLGCDRVEASFANNDNAPVGESRQGMTSALLGQVEESDEWVGYRALGLKKAIPASQASLSSPFGTSGSSSMATNTGSSTPLAQGLSPPLSLAASLPGPGAASRDTGSPTMEVTVKNETVDETSSIGNKDDDDDEEDDADDKMDTLVHDPERLKAFNMFVRLFVDENLDRMVPISRQPREKVQAIIDSCTRQFPEFGERARKRIRTYLKSCRRNKRSRDSNGWDTTRPTPPHLTSAAAEQILAQACENENQNAKRLRLGLEPISQPLPTPSTADRVLDTISSATGTTTSSAATGLDSNGAFRTAFGSPYNRTGGTLAITSSSSTSTSSNPPPANPYSSLPTDLSVKKAPTNHSSSTSTMTISSQTPSPCRTSPLPHKLNAAEMLAVRQLVTGYRESAAFLLRSADELEQLLLQQH